MKLCIFPVVLIMALLGACTEAPESDAKGSVLSSNQIQDMLVGNTLVSAASEENFFAVYYLEDGSERGVYNDDRDTGKWRAHQDALCSDWENWGNEESCFTLYRNASGEITAYKGTEKSFDAFIEEGNSRNL